MAQKIEQAIHIQAPVSLVWEHLTNPALMKRWMGEPEMQVEIQADWRKGQPLLIKGFHHEAFENKGIVLACEPNRLLQYSHLSSLSRLPDKEENYTVITFELQAQDSQTKLGVSVDNFPTESIYKHFEFYWRATLSILKQQVEGSEQNH